jgi:DNA-binding transcriptional MerR regulator
MGLPAVAANVIECLDTATVATLAQVNRSTLDYWVRTGLVTPSLRDSPGRRRTRLWKIEDAIVVRALAVLRHAGCPLQQIRLARSAIEADLGKRGVSATLVWNGSDVLLVDEQGEVESLLKYPGQRVFRAVALPVGRWSEETNKSVVFIWDDEIPKGPVFSTRELALAAR